MGTVFLELFGSFIGFVLITLLGQATRPLLDKTFVLEIFWKTNIVPLAYTALGGLVIISVGTFVPEYSFFVETLAGTTDIQMDNLPGLFAAAAAAALLGTVLKSIFKRSVTEVQNEITVRNLK